MKKSTNEQVAIDNFLEVINELLGTRPAKSDVIIFYGDSGEDELVSIIKENSQITGTVGNTTIYKSDLNEADWKGYFAFYPVEADEGQYGTLILQVFDHKIITRQSQ